MSGDNDAAYTIKKAAAKPNTSSSSGRGLLEEPRAPHTLKGNRAFESELNETYKENGTHSKDKAF